MGYFHLFRRRLGTKRCRIFAGISYALLCTVVQDATGVVAKVS
jgi:hypothetical protein